MDTWRFIIPCGLLLASTGLARAEAKALDLKDTPKPVQKAVQLWMAGGSLDSLDQVQEPGRVTYEIEFTNKAGKPRDFTLAENGTLLSLEIALADAPAPVQKTLKGLIGTGMLDSIEKNLDPDDTTFDIGLLTNDGKNRDFTLDGNGKIISERIELPDAPEVVQRAIKTQAAANPIEDIEKIFDEDNHATYQVALTTKDGTPRGFTIDGEDGHLESMEIGLTETPAPVQKTVAGEVGTGQIESIDKVFDPDGILYEVTYFAQAGSERQFTVDAEGNLASREVALADTPAPVQQTIMQQLGRGNVLRIDRTFTENTAGVFSFEVQAKKDGKSFDFSVGPNGRFLGMDD